MSTARPDSSDYLLPGELTRPTLLDMTRAAMDHIAPRPPAIGSPDHTITTGARERAIVDAVKAWRVAESRGLCVDDPEWRRLLDTIRDRADEVLGTGLFGGAA